MNKKSNQKEQTQRAFRLLEAIGALSEDQVEEALETPEHATSPATIHRHRRRPLWIASATAAILGISILSGSVYMQITKRIPSKTGQPNTENSGVHKEISISSKPHETQNTDQTPETELAQPAQKPLPDGTIRLLSTSPNKKQKKRFENIKKEPTLNEVQENESKDTVSQAHIKEENSNLQPLAAGEIQPLSKIKKTKKNLSISFTLQIGNKQDRALYQLKCNNIIWHIKETTDNKISTIQCGGGSTLTAKLQLPIKNGKIQTTIDDFFLPENINPDFSPLACITITACSKNTDDTDENTIGTGQLLIGTIQDGYYIVYH